MTKITQQLGQMLPAGNPVEQIEAIISRPDADLYIRAIPAPALYQLIKEAGWDQGVDLVPLASAEQMQVFLDLDAWRRDDFLPIRMMPWMAAMVEESSDETFKQVVRELDSEIMALLFKSQVQVMDLDEGRIPDDAPDSAVTSPDGMYVLVYPENEALAGLLKRMVMRLYELDRVLAWTLFEAARWELTSEMEEYALRWRRSRLEEFGFVSRDEAMSVYRPINALNLREHLEQSAPHTVQQAPEFQDLPAVIASEFEGDSLLLRALKRIPDAASMQARFFELRALLNKVLIADGVEPGELNSGRQVIRRAMGYASLGLEFMSRGGDEARQDVALERASLRDLFRAGYTLTAQLQHQALQLERRPTLTLLEGLPYSLLNPEDASLLEALSRTRPTYASSEFDFDIFSRAEQLDDAALRLGMIAFKQLWVFGIQRASVQDLVALATTEGLMNEPIEVTFDTIFTTYVARQLTQAGEGFAPLGRPEVAALLLATRAPQRPAQEQFARVFAQLQKGLPAGTERLLERWLEQTHARLHEELAQVEPSSAAMIARSILLLTT